MHVLQAPACPIVCGIASIDEAKITGITPPVLTRSGKIGRRPAVDPAADDAAGVLDRDLALGALDEDDRSDDHDHHRQQDDDGDRADRAGRDVLDRVGHRARKADDDPGVDDQRDAVADTALGDLLPSHMMNAVPVVSVSTVISGSSSRVDHDLLRTGIALFDSSHSEMPNDWTSESITVP